MIKYISLSFVLLFCVGCSTDREILDGSYWVVQNWYERYPEVRPLVDEAMKDNIIYYDEYIKIKDAIPTNKDIFTDSLKNAMKNAKQKE